MANSAALEGINRLRDIRRSPASHLAPALEAGSVQGKVVLAEGPFQTMAGVRVDPGSEGASRIAAATGGLPARCGEVTGTDGVSVLWLGPSEFLVVAPEEAHDSLGGNLIGSLTEALGDAPGTVTVTSATVMAMGTASLSVVNTPTGTNVTVPVASDVSLTFTSILSAGQTTAISSGSGPASPSGFELGNPPLYYDITTTAAYAGPVQVCIRYQGVSFGGSPRLFHYAFNCRDIGEIDTWKAHLESKGVAVRGPVAHHGFGAVSIPSSFASAALSPAVD